MTASEAGETDLIAIDTGVWLQGLLFGGTAEDLVRMAVIESVRLVTSERLLRDLAEVLAAPLAFSAAAIDEVLRFVRDCTLVIDDDEEARVQGDGAPALLRVARRAQASAIATTERSPLLALRAFDGIPIVAVA